VRRTLGALLMLGGGSWAAFGVWVFMTSMRALGTGPPEPAAGGAVLLITGLVFVFPGLVVLGIGALVYRRTSTAR
jgi:uncharacterized membrane protein YidH (DUF202 family)